MYSFFNRSFNAQHTARNQGTAPPSINMLPPPPSFLTVESTDAHISVIAQPGDNRATTATGKSTCKRQNRFIITTVK